MSTSTASSVLSVRVNPGERALLEAAAEQSHTNLSDFIRRKALEAAEIDILNRSTVTIASDDWAKFEAWVAQPAETSPGLQDLARVTPTWER
jgi:uncharacterized protein (DUF1778 family)